VWLFLLVVGLVLVLVRWRRIGHEKIGLEVEP
jgi:hypothetical protein